MFGTNEIVGQKYFSDAPKDSLMITSMFFTVQGEGPYMGQPAYFFRLSKCNLNCSFCDAFFDKGEYYTHQELLEKMESEVPDYFKGNGLIVLTGGEPCLQDIGPFISFLMDRGYHTQIETNGILLTFQRCNFATVVCSPKCSEKTGKYLNLSDGSKSMIDALKFVVSADPKSPYHRIPDWALEWKEKYGGKIYLSPMNEYERLPSKARGTGNLEERSTKDEIISFWETGMLDMKANQANHEWAGKYALEIGANLNIQMHLLVSMA